MIFFSCTPDKVFSRDYTVTSIDDSTFSKLEMSMDFTISGEYEGYIPMTFYCCCLGVIFCVTSYNYNVETDHTTFQGVSPTTNVEEQNMTYWNKDQVVCWDLLTRIAKLAFPTLPASAITTGGDNLNTKFIVGDNTNTERSVKDWWAAFKAQTGLNQAFGYLLTKTGIQVTNWCFYSKNALSYAQSGKWKLVPFTSEFTTGDVNPAKELAGKLTFALESVSENFISKYYPFVFTRKDPNDENSEIVGSFHNGLAGSDVHAWYKDKVPIEAEGLTGDSEEIIAKAVKFEMVYTGSSVDHLTPEDAAAIENPYGKYKFKLLVPTDPRNSDTWVVNEQSSNTDLIYYLGGFSLDAGTNLQKSVLDKLFEEANGYSYKRELPARYQEGELPMPRLFTVNPDTAEVYSALSGKLDVKRMVYSDLEFKYAGSMYLN